MIPVSCADLPLMDVERRREQRSWYWYDWANSAYVTTTLTVLFSPYLTVVAKRAACPGQDTDLTCDATLSVLGIPVSPGSLALYTITVATLLSALLLPVVGAVVDRSGRKRVILARIAWVGAVASSAMIFVGGTAWGLGVVLALISSLSLGCSLVVYDSVLVDISTADERDAVSSRGWAFGYLGGGLLLALNLALVGGHDVVDLSKEWAVRVSLLSAGVWWGVFTVIPFRGLRDRVPLVVRSPGGGNTVSVAFGQLWRTLRDLRGYPQTMLFLVGYLFYNDGIQTVIYASGVFGQEELKLETNILIVTILVVQFVGFVGALFFGWLAGRIGARRTVVRVRWSCGGHARVPDLRGGGSGSGLGFRVGSA